MLDMFAILVGVLGKVLCHGAEIKCGTVGCSGGSGCFGRRVVSVWVLC